MKKNLIIGLAMVLGSTVFAVQVHATTYPLDSTSAPFDISTFQGEALNDYAGRTVSAAGDVNGDGYDDFLIGSYGHNTGFSFMNWRYTWYDVGAVYLRYGSSTAYGANLNTTNMSKFTGEASLDYLGHSIAAAGDVNGDGYDDIIMGAYGHDYNSTTQNSGAVYVILGDAARLSDIQVNSSNTIKYWSQNANDRAGYSVAGAGDVNYDGCDDMLVGVSQDDEGGTNAGAAYVIFGQGTVVATGLPCTVTTTLTGGALSSTSALKLVGAAAGDYAGYAVAGAGDVDGDAYDDMLVGAPYNDSGATDAGAMHLIYGDSTMSVGSQGLSSAATFTGEAAINYAGLTASGAGDVDNDSYADFVVGAIGNSDAGTEAGAAYLVYGDAVRCTSQSSFSIAVQFTGEVTGDAAGYSVSGAGDMDDDGFDDFLVGAYLNDDNGTNAGAAYLVYGDAVQLTPVSLSTVDQLTGEDPGDYAGYAVAGAGSVDGTAGDDILIGAYLNANSRSVRTGAAYLVTGL